MKCRTWKKVIMLLAIIGAFGTMSLFGWDEGYLSLTVPVKTDAPLAIEPDLSVRMLQVIPPDQAAFRISDGVILFNTAKMAISYMTNQRELSADLSGWLAVADFKFGASIEGIWADDPNVAGSRYWSAAGTLFGWGWIVPSVLNIALNLQYDLFFENFNAGMGASVSILPDTLSIVAEGLVSPLGVFAWAWDAGVLIKTAGHQFYIYVGNGNDMRMRNILDAAPNPGAVAFGFTLRRRIDIFF